MQNDQENITFFAKADARGQNVPFGIKAKDRTRHVYVIGKTGMGKSTLLENMAVQDIQQGNGVAFIDPHGATAETLLNYVPESRKKDVLYFAPFDTSHPVAFNVMEDVGVERRHLVASGLMSVFKKIFVDAWSARMEYILTNTIMALLEYPDSTLLGVNRMLSDKAYRKKVVNNIKDPAVKSFWVDEFANYNERYMQEAGDAIKNKIGQFTANPLIRNIIGQPKSSFDLRAIMDEKKIIIMNLSKGLVGESNANLLGSMLTTRIYLAAMSRADFSPQEMKAAPNFYFYVDEFQSFANATFADILSEARKYKLNLTIAHQYIEQMEEEVRNAVFGNVGTTIAFRVGPFDAEVLETIFSPQFLAVDICNLGFAQIYLSLMIDGIGSRPFSATTLPPIAPPEVSYRDVVVAESRRQFAFLRAEVEENINAWHNSGNEPTPPRTDTKPRERSEEPKRDPRKDGARAPLADKRPNINPRPNAPRNDTRPAERPHGERPPRTEQKPPVAKVPTTKESPASTDQLRKVLQSIAEKSRVDGTPESKPQPKPAPVASTNKSPSSLRTALADVLASSETSKKSESTPEPKQVADQVHASPKQPAPQAASPAPQPAPQEKRDTTPTASVPAEPTTADFDLKKIERMLRSHSSDKSPLK